LPRTAIYRNWSNRDFSGKTYFFGFLRLRLIRLRFGTGSRTLTNSRLFLNQFLAENELPQKALSSEALSKLKEYHYPGNIRELSKIIKNSAFFTEAGTILPEDIDFCLQSDTSDIWAKTRRMPLIGCKECFERELITRRMTAMNNDVRKVAESLGMIKNNLYRKLKYFSIDY